MPFHFGLWTLGELRSGPVDFFFCFFAPVPPVATKKHNTLYNCLMSTSVLEEDVAIHSSPPRGLSGNCKCASEIIHCVSPSCGTVRTHPFFLLPISHEYISGYYRVSVYFLSKILSDILTLRTLPGLVFSCVAYFMIGSCTFFCCDFECFVCS